MTNKKKIAVVTGGADLIGGKKVFIPNRPGESMHSCADIRKIKRELKWKPKTLFKDGIAKMLNEISKWKDAPILTSKGIKKVNQNLLNFLKRC